MAYQPGSWRNSLVTDSVKPGVTAVVWDLDGTLVDSAADIAASLNRLLAEQGLPALGDDRIRDMIGEGVRTLIRRGLAAHEVTPDDARLDGLVKRFLVIYAEVATESTRLFPGAREALKMLSILSYSPCLLVYLSTFMSPPNMTASSAGIF